jgi:glycosyltransferase involved in cell wall biosynthesis
VALQAAQMARPVVAARVGGLPEVVVHDVTGLLVEPEHSAALTEAICFLLEHPGRAVAMGRAARRRARQNFAWTRLVDAYDAVYQRIA